MAPIWNPNAVTRANYQGWSFTSELFLPFYVVMKLYVMCECEGEEERVTVRQTSSVASCAATKQLPPLRCATLLPYNTNKCCGCLTTTFSASSLTESAREGKPMVYIIIDHVIYSYLCMNAFFTVSLPCNTENNVLKNWLRLFDFARSHISEFSNHKHLINRKSGLNARGFPWSLSQQSTGVTNKLCTRLVTGQG